MLPRPPMMMQTKKKRLELEDEGVGRDVALQAANSRAGDPGGDAAEDEHRELGAEQRHADRLRRDRVVADRHQADAPHASGDVPGQPRRQHRERGDQVVEAVRRVERRREHRTGQADAAAGEADLREDDLADDQGERHRRHREVEAGQAQRRQAERQPAEAAERARRDQSRCRMPAHLAGEDGEGVGADREQADVADRQLPGVADDQVEAGDQDPVDADQRRQVQLVLIARPARQGGDEQRRDREGDAGAQVRRHTGLTFFEPSRPSGLSSSTTISRPTAIVCW